MKTSEILWISANERLWDGVGYRDDPPWEYSCDAVFAHRNLRQIDADRTRVFLAALGVNTIGLNQFREFKNGLDRQGARYAWLMFASMYAEELGI